MTDIWVIFGSTGEYSDYRDWPVVWYADEKAANEARDAYEDAYCRVFGVPKGTVYFNTPDYDKRAKMEETMRLIDSDFMIDYTGTQYTVVRVPTGPDVTTIQALGEQDG